jgi:hypothetical protein
MGCKMKIYLLRLGETIWNSARRNPRARDFAHSQTRIEQVQNYYSLEPFQFRKPLMMTLFCCWLGCQTLKKNFTIQ